MPTSRALRRSGWTDLLITCLSPLGSIGKVDDEGLFEGERQKQRGFLSDEVESEPDKKSPT